MSLSTAIMPAALDTVIALLAPYFLFGANDDIAVARHAAACMLADYDAETEEELRLATQVISFGFQALQALSEAAGPDVSLNRIMRLRGSAVSLNRSSQQSQRKLDRLQRDRRAAMAEPRRTAASAAANANPEPRDPTPVHHVPAQLDAAPAAPTQPVSAQPGLDEMPGMIQSAAEAFVAGGGASHKKIRVWSREAQDLRVAERLAANQLRKQVEQSAQRLAPDPATVAPMATAAACYQPAAA